jgi:general secretion pathway protein D
MLCLLAASFPGVPSEHTITLNFRDADIDSVVGAFGHLLNRTFLIDPRVRGKITLETPRPVSREQAFRLLQATLRMQGFAIVETGTLSRVVPEADAKLQAAPVSAGRAPGPAGDQVITQIFRLTYESASNLVPVLRPLIPPNNTIVAYPNNNSLVITDYASNLQRLARIIATLDSPASNEVEVISIKHALASDIALQVSRMVDEQGRVAGPGPGPGQPGGGVDAGQRVQVMADPRINSIMIRSPSLAKMNLAKTLIARLDQPSSEPGNIRVVYLRNAEATRLVQVLRAVLAGSEGGSPQQPGMGMPGGQGGFAGQQTGMGAAGGPGGPTPATGALAQPGAGAAVTTVAAGGAVIAADPATNSLIITAPEPIYRNLRSVIDKLDARRVQVYIESLIVEVQADRATELGVQWQFLSQPNGSGVIGGTNLPSRGTGNNIIDAATGLLGIGRGINIGVVRSAPLIGASGEGVGINLGFLARALETEAGANILATPNLLTLDNEEARIIIGQNVPFITGSFTGATGGGGAVNPFQTIERRDVGTTLRVRPQVAEGGTVKMQIFQEVSSVQDASLAAGLITNKRAIESNVLVDDGQVIVLGGLIEERLEGGVSMVPGLGRLPIIGNLFRYDNRRRVKTNLLVFLRPVVMRNAEQTHAVTSDRYDYIRQLQGSLQVTPSELLPAQRGNEMDPMPPRPGTSGIAPPSLAPQLNQAMPDRWRAVEGRPPGVIQTAPNEIIVIPRRLEGPEDRPDGVDQRPAGPETRPGAPVPPGADRGGAARPMSGAILPTLDLRLSMPAAGPALAPPAVTAPAAAATRGAAPASRTAEPPAARPARPTAPVREPMIPGA